MSGLPEAKFESLLQAYREGVLLGDLGGCRVWLQLLGAFILERDPEGAEGGQRRLLLGEVQVGGTLAPRNALVIPWEEIVGVEEVAEGEARIMLRHGVLRLLTPARLRQRLEEADRG